MRSMRSASLAVLVAATLAGAALADEQADDLPLDEFMGHVMQRNAEQLWSWSAEEVGTAGELSGRPQTDAAWEEAESDALTLRQLARGLAQASFAPDDPRWRKLAGDLQQAATASAAAAERKDYAAFSRAGDEINARCVACHLTFAPQLEVVPPQVQPKVQQTDR